MKKVPAYLTLAIITVVAAALLALTNHITREPIAAASEQAAYTARCNVLPAADSFNHLTPPEGVSSLCQATADGVPVGYVAIASTRGYGGPIEVTVGVDLDGTITGLCVGGSAFAETAGLGSHVKDVEFTSQFAGKTAPLELGADVDSISGATVSSRAVVNGVNIAAQAAVAAGQ